VARVLIVGCGCRGRALASALAADGHLVRGTTRGEQKLVEIERAGAEAVLADPNRLATLLPHLRDVTVLCWLVGPRPQSLIGALIDTPVRGLVYEGSEAPELRAASETYRIPFELIDEDPEDHEAWLACGRSAVARLLWHASPGEVGNRLSRERGAQLEQGGST
jgi:hypothetical protein